MRVQSTLLAFLFFIAACSGDNDSSSHSSQADPHSASGSAVVLAANDLGMHCMDREYSVFSILPPFNVIHAQIVKQDGYGHPYISEDGEVEVSYQAAADPSGSMNSYSIGKTDFWQYGSALFGVHLTEGQGLTGYYMPLDNPQTPGSQSMVYDGDNGWFSAEGIPITPIDDNLAENPYPLLRIAAADAETGEIMGQVDVVVPVASETDCYNCHRTGGIAAREEGVDWSTDVDTEIQTKINILKIHDADHQTQLEASQPVLCAQCHYSPALDLAGVGPTVEQMGNPYFSRVMHAFHGALEENGAPVFSSGGAVEDTCYQCHPGNLTQCLRGAMKTGGMDCHDCHGDMLAVGGDFPLGDGGSIDGTNDGHPRRPWLDLPRCQSCHTGDAVDYLRGAELTASPDWPFRLRQAYADGDKSASPLTARNQRFAENSKTRFRFSKGHGGLFCEACHGSTHAIWPNGTESANDNIAAKSLQGFAGPLIDCDLCHQLQSLPITIDGPHGLHNINDPRWYDDGHEEYYEHNKNTCRACHGLDLTGTPLARMPTARNFDVEAEEEGEDHDDERQTVTYLKGDLVRCDRCHEMPEI